MKNYNIMGVAKGGARAPGALHGSRARARKAFGDYFARTVRAPRAASGIPEFDGAAGQGKSEARTDSLASIDAVLGRHGVPRACTQPA